jgi:type I restriction enzyme S subunit
MVLFGMRIAMNQTCYALRSKKGNHFYIYCQARHAIGGLVHSAHGSVFDTVTTRTFETTPVLVPDPSAAEAFDMAVQPLFSQILARQQESVSLAAIRDALLPKLLSGGIRVGGIHGIVWERKQCCPSP